MPEGAMPVALALIPARYASTRLPGKPLALIAGHPMLEWVYRRAAHAIGLAVVATDDERIYEAVLRFGGRTVMTSSTHRSGTDRCAEALQHLRAEGLAPELVINVQGDEPFVSVGNLRKLASAFCEEEVNLATLVRPFAPGDDVANPNWPKVLSDLEGNALVFTRAVVPYPRNSELLPQLPYQKHIGVYAYRAQTLLELARLAPDILEQIEGLEQLRWLRHGYQIRTVQVPDEGMSVDTPEDLQRADLFAQQHYAQLWIEE